MLKAGDAVFEASLTPNNPSLSGSGGRMYETLLIFLPRIFLP